MRYKLNELLTQIANRLPDNTTGAITAAVMRDLLIDFVHSFRGALTVLRRAAAPVAVPLTTAFQTPAALFDTVTNNDVTELEGAVGTQVITAKVAANYEFTIDVTAEGATNDELIIALMVDGVANPYFQTRSQMGGAGKPVAPSVTGYVALNAGQTLSLGVRLETAAANVTLGPIGMIVSLTPSRT